MNIPRMPIASIVFEGDLRLQILQILSIDRLYDHSSAPEYTIVVNSETPDDVKSSILDSVFDILTDELKQKLEFLEFADLLPDSKRGGYYDQQALKLALAKYYMHRYDVPVYLMLDAKNHFVSPVSPEDLFNDDRPLTNRVETSSYWSDYVRKSLKALGVDEAQGEFMIPSITPYVLYIDQVAALTEYIVDRYHTDLLTAIGKTGGTEFLLYYAQILKSGAISRYDFGGQPARTLFTNWPQDSNMVMDIIYSCVDERVCVFGLHRNRLPQLSVEQTRAISEMWHRHLLRDGEDSNWFLGRETVVDRAPESDEMGDSSDSEMVETPIGERRGAIVPTSAQVGASSVLIAAEGKRIKLERAVAIGESCSLTGDVVVGDGTAIGAGVLISGEVVIGRDVTIESGAVVSGRVRIGDRVHVSEGTHIYGLADLYADCVIEPGARLFGRRLVAGPAQRRGRNYRDSLISIGRGSTIGQEAIVTGECQIGAGTVVQAGAMVSGRFDEDSEIESCAEDILKSQTLLKNSTYAVPSEDSKIFWSKVPSFQINRIGLISPQAGFSRYSMRLADESVLGFLVKNCKSEVLVVSLHGAINSHDFVPSNFEFSDILLEQKHSLMFVEDPGLGFHPDIQTGWYLGTRQFDLHQCIAVLAEEVASEIGANKIVFIGSSDAGFAALQIASHSSGSTALVFDARTEVPVLEKSGGVFWPFYFFLSNAMPEIVPSRATPESFADEWDDSLGDRVSARRRYQVPTNCSVVFVSDTNSSSYETEYIPYLESMNPNNQVRSINYAGGATDYNQRRKWFLFALGEAITSF